MNAIPIPAEHHMLGEILLRSSKVSAEDLERERREIQQFVFALRGPSSASQTH